jgi:two-component system CheB/CheR fusion protein
MSLFHLVLKPGGFLFLGSSESTGPNSELFAPLDQKWKIFQRRECERSNEALFPFTSPVLKLARGVSHRPSAETEPPSPGALAEKLLVERYSPPCVVVNDKFEVLHVSSRTKRYLEVPVGKPTLDILKMAREELRPALRAAICKAFTETKQVNFRGVKLAGDEGAAAVNIMVEPLVASPSCGKLVLVILEPAATPTVLQVPSNGDAFSEDDFSRENLIRQLEEQLRITHEQLQFTTEQLDASNEGFMATNEELMSINEEFQSANEELQSTNEELEASKEELQALNEELVTVNAELQGKVEELNQANSDMENLFASSAIATIFLDRNLIIKRFSPAMAVLLNLIPADIGRPFRHLGGAVDWSGLPGDAREVLEKQTPILREVSALENGRCYIMRVLPYRTTAGHIDGIVVTLMDISERKRGEEELRQAKEEWERTFDSVPDLIAILDDKHRIVRANRAMAERLGLAVEECVGRHCFSCVHPANKPPGNCPHAMTLADGLEHVAEVFEERLGGIFLVSTTPLMDGRGRMIGTVHVARDITERKKTEAEILRHVEELERFNRVSVGRELRMIELKKEVNNLCSRLGKLDPYPLEFGED